LASKNFASLSIQPGRTGTFFYSKGFNYLNLDASYRAFSCKNVVEFREFVYNSNYHGISVSMPFKSIALEIAQIKHESAVSAQCANTLLRKQDNLYQGFSTDLEGMNWLVNEIISGQTAILGNGAMGKMLAQQLSSQKRPHKVFARKLNNWDQRHGDFDTIINCTALGTSSPESPLSSVRFGSTVVDLSISRGEFEGVAVKNRATYVPGIRFYGHVFKSQFEIYTGCEIPFRLISQWEQDWIKNYA
jgi:shikimate dehydrogenase